MTNHQDSCSFCGGLLRFYSRRDQGIDDEGHRYLDFIDYAECENCGREDNEIDEYDGVIIR